MTKEETILSGKRNIYESFIRRGRAFRWLGVYLFSPQILHVRCLSSIDRHAYSWHTMNRPLACPGSKNGKYAALLPQCYNSTTGTVIALFCTATTCKVGQHSTSEKKGLTGTHGF